MTVDLSINIYLCKKGNKALSLNGRLFLLQGPMPCTPTTQAYIEETRLSGLPVIPFAYPTCFLVEKMKNRTRDRVRQLSGEYPSTESAQTVTSGKTSLKEQCIYNDNS